MYGKKEKIFLHKKRVGLQICINKLESPGWAGCHCRGMEVIEVFKEIFSRLGGPARDEFSEGSWGQL